MKETPANAEIFLLVTNRYRWRSRAQPGSLANFPRNPTGSEADSERSRLRWRVELPCRPSRRQPSPRAAIAPQDLRVDAKGCALVGVADLGHDVRQLGT